MSRAPTASALISTFVRDILHSLLILRHGFIGQRWPSSVIAGCRTAPGRPRPPSAAEDSASILRVTVMQDRRPGQCGLPDVADDLPIQFAETARTARQRRSRMRTRSLKAIVRTSPSATFLFG